MAGKRRPIPLRKKREAYVADIYQPDGKRTTVSFVVPKSRTESEIHIAFSKWLDLFKEHPSKVLSFDSPYDALDSMIHPGKTLLKYQLHRDQGAFRPGVRRYSALLLVGGPCLLKGAGKRTRATGRSVRVCSLRSVVWGVPRRS